MAGASAGATAGAAASADAESEGLAALGSGSYCDQSWLAAHPWFSAWLQQWQGVCKHLGGCKLLTPCPTRACARARAVGRVAAALQQHAHAVPFT